jgi:glycosyltransferase involved in cell wall biosynthesis
MPAYNESATIRNVIHRVLERPEVGELIVVDDSSTDETWSNLQVLSSELKARNGGQDGRLRLLRHERNAGKGAAVRTGIKHATRPIVVIQDADLEYDPAEYGLLINPIIKDRADAVFGSRFIGSNEHRVLYFWHSVGNKLLTLFSNMCSNINLTDMETCYKAFRRELIQSIDLCENRFGFEPEVTAKLARRSARMYEVAISYYGRTYAEGKKINWKDGFSAIRCILKYGLLGVGSTKQ